MTRVYHIFQVNEPIKIKQQMLNWLRRFNICCFLDNHNYSSPLHSYECLAAAGAVSVFDAGNDFFSSLSSFVSQANDWIFGHLNYDVKNFVEPDLTSKREDKLHFPVCFLFIPEIVLQLKGSELIIGVVRANAEEIYREIIHHKQTEKKIEPISFKPAISKEQYLHTVSCLQDHIKKGDCYVINYCQEFYATCCINPAYVYNLLTHVSPNPFSAFYRLNDKYLICASPERYLKKKGRTIVSQPIKGTSARDHINSEKDKINKSALLESEKERSENVMVVDLVRNDLSKVCKEGSVVVNELFGIYTYPTVHQMISTVSGTLLPDADFSDIIKATFPMGSMTVAPKKKVMQLIEQFEQSRRGLYSGSLGYITPSGDFDFNVVIRSILYNATNNYLSYHVGSAITANSDADKEYAECLLKAAAIVNIFSGNAKK